jgi:hypothetical protein
MTPGKCFRILSILLCLAAGVNAAKAAGLETIQMPEQSNQFTLNWVGAADKCYMRWVVRVEDGTIYVCGNYATCGHSLRRATRKKMRDMKVLLDGRPILKNLTFFTEYRNKDLLVGSPAACRSTGVGAPRSGKHEVSIDAGGKILYGDY